MDFMSAASNTLGIEVGDSLIGLNLSNLQNVLHGILKKLAKNSQQIDRLEYEMDARAIKSDVSAIKDMVRGLATKEEYNVMVDRISKKADRDIVEDATFGVQELKDKFVQLEKVIFDAIACVVVIVVTTRDHNTLGVLITQMCVHIRCIKGMRAKRPEIENMESQIRHMEGMLVEQDKEMLAFKKELEDLKEATKKNR